MISILAQERLLGAALGAVFSGVVIFELRRDIYNTISPPKSQMKEPISKRKIEFAHYWNKSVDQVFGPAIQMKEPISKRKIEFAHYWNKSVDQVFGPAIQVLSSKGW